MTPKTGETAPDFSGQSDDGVQVSASQRLGRWTVLFFFPKANTPHCAMESRRFQRAHADFQALGAEVVGVSVDPASQHHYFRNSCQLNFPLIADDGSISAAYGVLTDSPIEGEEGVKRAARQSFLIDPQGRIAQHWAQVEPSGHADEVLAELKRRLGPPLPAR